MLKPTAYLFLTLISLAAAAQSDEFLAAQDFARTDASSLHYDKKRNLYIKDDVVHIFLFEDGNNLLTGYPTTATEHNKFQVHLYLTESNNSTYILQYAGSFTPSLNIESGTKAVTRGLGASKIKKVDFAKIGPFTGTFSFSIKKKGTTDVLAGTTITLAKVIHASVGTGFFYSTLRDPENIQTMVLPNGDTTLNADQQGGRGLLTIMATFYPWGRNQLYLPPNTFKDRFGISMGTSIGGGKSNFRNFFLGAQYDFAIGGSITFGAHYGKRQKISGLDYRDFEFGETVFSGDLEKRKYTDWDLGFFIGLQADSRIFAFLFQ